MDDVDFDAFIDPQIWLTDDSTLMQEQQLLSSSPAPDIQSSPSFDRHADFAQSLNGDSDPFQPPFDFETVPLGPTCQQFRNSNLTLVQQATNCAWNPDLTQNNQFFGNSFVCPDVATQSLPMYQSNTSVNAAWPGGIVGYGASGEPGCFDVQPATYQDWCTPLPSQTMQSSSGNMDVWRASQLPATDISTLPYSSNGIIDTDLSDLQLQYPLEPLLHHTEQFSMGTMQGCAIRNATPYEASPNPDPCMAMWSGPNSFEAQQGTPNFYTSTVASAPQTPRVSVRAAKSERKRARPTSSRDGKDMTQMYDLMLESPSLLQGHDPDAASEGTPYSIDDSAYLSDDFKQSPGEHRFHSAEIRRQNRIMLHGRKHNLNYTQIQALIQCLCGAKVELSTLRGRNRVLTTPRKQRQRNPKWTDSDVKLLHLAVERYATLRFTPEGTVDSSKGPAWNKSGERWSKVASSMAAHGCSYPFSQQACSKKWKETCDT